MEGLATRYASGLLKVAIEEDAIRSYKKWLIEFDHAFESDPSLMDFFASEFVTLSAKEQLIDSIISDDAKYVASFIKLLIIKKRLLYFHGIKKEFVRLANAKLGIKEGTIYSKKSLTEHQIEAIETRLSKQMKTEVELDHELDSRLLGGFKIVIQGQIFDYSLNDKLQKLGQQMLERGDLRAH